MSDVRVTDLPQLYPLPAPADDPRFTYGLVIDLVHVLTAHGYPPVRSGADLVALQQALFGFLYTFERSEAPQ